MNATAGTPAGTAGCVWRASPGRHGSRRRWRELAVWHTIWSIWNHLDTSPPDSLLFGEGMVFGVLALLPNALIVQPADP